MPANVFSFTVLNSVDSTNNYAMAKVHEGLAKNGDAFFARTQTNGKGQRDKTWETGNDENIAVSIVIQPVVQNQFYLSAAIALACYDFFSDYAGNGTTIKWPNDIYWRDRKAGGILIETIFRGKDWKYAIAGIGININQVKFPEALKKIVSLKQITGKNFDVISLAKELHLTVMKRIASLNIISPEELLEEYNLRLYKLNEKVKLKYDNKIYEAVIKGVNAKGQLIVFTEREELFDFGSVSWIQEG